MRKRWLFLFVFEFFCLAILSVVLQFLYPSGRLLPFVRINGENHGLQTVVSAAKKLQASYTSAHVEIHAGGALTLAPFDQVGLDVNTIQTAKLAGEYTTRQRFIPFSALVVMFHRDSPMQVRIDKERVQYFAQQFEESSTIPAVNAAVRVSEDKVSLVPAKPKQTFPATTTYQAIIHARISPDIKIAPSPVVTAAEVSSSAGKAMQAQAQAIIDTPLKLTLGDMPETPSKATVASWLDFPVIDGKMQLAFKDDLVQQYVRTAQTAIYQAPTATRIATLDGTETARIEGVTGKGIDIADAAKKVEAYLRERQSAALVLATVPLAPGITYDRHYTDTTTGLHSLLGDLTAGKDYAVSVIELSGKGRDTNVNGDKVYMAASTYKLYISYGLFQLIDNGEMHWSDKINGLSADACFQKMIVVSDNPCANAFGDRIGWSRVQDMMTGLGLTHTHLEKNNNSTTANDLSFFLHKLADGSLLSDDHANQLTGYMKQQVYRKGIPAGTGVAVADKVGFIYGNIHDAGIVYGPNGTYIEVIMTNNSSWTALASVAHDIHAYLTR